jgi:hypothetical protein
LTALWVGIAFATGVARDFVATFHDAMRGITYKQHGADAVAQQGIRQIVFGLLVGGLGTIGLGCYYRLALNQLRGEKASVGIAFSSLRLAMPLFVVGVVMEVPEAITGAVQLLSPIGYYLLLLPTWIIQGLLMFVVPLVVDRNLGPVAALTESITLLKRQWIMATVFFFLGQIFGAIGALFCGVGALVTYPLFILGVTIAYLNFTSPPTPPVLPDYGQPMPGVWPPPPTGGRPGSVAFMQESRPVMENIRRL